MARFRGFLHNPVGRGILFAAFALIAMVNSAAALERIREVDRLKRLLDLLTFAMDVNENAGKVDEGMRMLLGEDSEALKKLRATEKRSSAYKVEGEVKPPIVSGETLFNDIESFRKIGRDRWGEFVEQDQTEIDRMQRRRDNHADNLENYQKRLTAMEKYRDFLEEMYSSPQSGLIAEESARKWVELVQGPLHALSGIVSSHERIVREFDKLLAERRAKHILHKATLNAIDAIHGEQQRSSQPANPSSRAKIQPSSEQRNQPQSAANKPRPSIDQRIEDAVRSVGASGTLHEADSVRARNRELQIYYNERDAQAEVQQRSNEETTPSNTAPKDDYSAQMRFCPSGDCRSTTVEPQAND